jgi:hypothetical protein
MQCNEWLLPTMQAKPLFLHFAVLHIGRQVQKGKAGRATWVKIRLVILLLIIADQLVAVSTERTII